MNLKKRLYGLEVEYLPIFNKSPKCRDDLDNLTIYLIFVEVLKEKFATMTTRYRNKEGLFLENGIKINYEGQGHCFFDGLIEFSTPECSTVREVVLYQKLIDTIIQNSLPEVEKRLKMLGYKGKLIFAKNTLDVKGNTSGSHENYLVNDKQSILTKILSVFSIIGLLGIGFISLNILLTPVVIIVLGIIAILLAGTTLGVILYSVLMILNALPLINKLIQPLNNLKKIIVRKMKRTWNKATNKDSLEKFIRLQNNYMKVFFFPARIYSFFIGKLVFKKYKKQLTTFLISREIMCGTGWVHIDEDEYQYKISQKAESINSIIRIFFDDKNKPIFDIKNFLFHPFSLLHDIKQLHIMLSDSNMSEMSLFLKFGSTSLVLEMIENDYLDEMNFQLKHPIRTLKLISSDPQLKKRFLLKNGTKKTALELQQAYLTKAKQYFIDYNIEDEDKLEILEVWDDTLRRLSTKRSSLENRLDWVIKKNILKRLKLDANGLDLPKWLPIINRVNENMKIPDSIMVLNNNAQFVHYIREFMENESFRQLQKEFINQDLTVDFFNYFYLLYYKIKKVDIKYHFLFPQGYFSKLEESGVIEKIFYLDDIEQVYFDPPQDTRAKLRSDLIKVAHTCKLKGKASWNYVKMADPVTKTKIKVKLNDLFQTELTTPPLKLKNILKKYESQQNKIVL